MKYIAIIGLIFAAIAVAAISYAILGELPITQSFDNPFQSQKINLN